MLSKTAVDRGFFSTHRGVILETAATENRGAVDKNRGFLYSGC